MNISTSFMSMTIIFIELFVFTRNLIKQCIPCFRRTNIVLQSNVYDNRALDLVCKRNTIEIRKGIFHCFTTTWVMSQVIVYFLVWIGMSQFNSIHVSTLIRGTGRRGLNFLSHCRRCDCEAPTLATTCHSNSLRVDFIPIE